MSCQKQKIIPHLWFDKQAEEAASFYTSIFKDSKMGKVTRYVEAGKEIHGKEPGSIMTVDFELAGQHFIALNGGPHFSFTPAISFYVTCESEGEVDNLWKELSKGGTPLMPIGEYEWSPKYGWIEDQYGISWQVSLGKLDDVHGQKIVPSLMFVDNNGKAEEAIRLYTSLFEGSDITGILQYGANEDQPEGTVKHSQFRLGDEVFMAMDSSPEYADFTFSEAISLLIQCELQEEIDYLWNKLSAVPEAEQCGWLKDKFGVSWQVAPTILQELLLDSDKEKVERVTKVFLGMKKMKIKQLKEAYENN